MTRTFSTKFPNYHPKAGTETHFVEKVWLSLIDCGLISLSKACELSRQTGIGNFDMHNIRKCKLEPKGHTIRPGHKLKPGDFFSPRIWGNDINPKSGRSGPYHSKQIIIAPDIEVQKTWNFSIKMYNPYTPPPALERINYFLSIQVPMPFKGLETISDKPHPMFKEIAKNDGLAYDEFLNWFILDPKFRKTGTFTGQIICWNENINYLNEPATH